VGLCIKGDAFAIYYARYKKPKCEKKVVFHMASIRTLELQKLPNLADFYTRIVCPGDARHR
jgi:hypothetical protein